MTPPANSTGTINVSVALGTSFAAGYNTNTASADAAQIYDKWEI